MSDATTDIVTGWTEIAPGFAAYQAVPSGQDPAGAVIVLPELFGLNADIRGVVERLAREGYAAVAPDVHWRREPRASLPYGDAGRTRGFELLHAITRAEVLADLAAAHEAALRLAPGGRVAVFGVSFGGHLGLLGATELPFALVVSVYGGWTVHGGIPVAEPRPPLADAPKIAANGAFVLGFYGTLDHAVQPSEVEEIEALLTEAKVPHEVVRIPGVGHGFLCEARPDDYDADAAALTWAKVNQALREQLTVPDGA
ncbi:dienelactone hydrolase family protein [Streptacidiphilus cavernicola]|uniref:Dienelactone hydrolase family protein n=1 Tax=Streptacidiphilus cavernicola TaxID=3342716 RepID=A0ABV6W2N6_9ACTN